MVETHTVKFNTRGSGAIVELLLGTWQQVVFLEFDNRPREREIIFQIVGDKG
jgi:thiamine phosphate synthase YjbQ (UPF0047 family)